MERRVLALVLIVAGIWVQFGPGWALMVAGVGVALSGIDAPAVVERTQHYWSRATAPLHRHPRRASAAGLMSSAVVLVPVGLGLAFGIWAALAAAGTLSGVIGAVLGWE